ncbi:MAG: hypothetical protein ACTH7L_01740 [Psychrobacter alimentarius]
MSDHKVVIIGNGMPVHQFSLHTLLKERAASYRHGIQDERERLYKLSADEFLSEKLLHQQEIKAGK